MPVKLEKTQIGGATWELNTLPATKGITALTKLAAIVGSPLGEIGSAGVSSGGDALDLQGEVLGRAIAQITQRLDDPGTIELVNTLVGKVKKNGKDIVFDDEFAGNYSTLVQLLGWAIKVNFSDFFEGSQLLQGLAGKVRESVRSTSTGGSGES